MYYMSIANAIMFSPGLTVAREGEKEYSIWEGKDGKRMSEAEEKPRPRAIYRIPSLHSHLFLRSAIIKNIAKTSTILPFKSLGKDINFNTKQLYHPVSNTCPFFRSQRAHNYPFLTHKFSYFVLHIPCFIRIFYHSHKYQILALLLTSYRSFKPQSFDSETSRTC